MKPWELSRTHTSISYTRRHLSGWGMGDTILSCQSRRVWQVRLGDRVAILPGQAGTNLRRTARYAEEDPDPLHDPTARKSGNADGAKGLSHSVYS